MCKVSFSDIGTLKYNSVKKICQLFFADILILINMFH